MKTLIEAYVIESSEEELLCGLMVVPEVLADFDKDPLKAALYPESTHAKHIISILEREGYEVRMSKVTMTIERVTEEISNEPTPLSSQTPSAYKL